MSKPHIEKQNSNFINDSSDQLVSGGQLTKEPVDLFYEIEPAEVLATILTRTD